MKKHLALFLACLVLARNISAPRLMRDRVVGKELCQPLG